MNKIVWTFGLISGAILSALMLLTIPFAEAIGYDRALIVGYTTMLLAFLLTFFGIRAYRDNVGGGAIRFGRALAVGSLITLVSSVCYVVTWELISFKIAPHHVERFEAAMLEKARTSGGSAEEVQKRVDDAQKFARLYRNPVFNAAMAFIEPLPVGLLFTLVSAGILSRRRSKPSELAMSAG
jgi:hypothetical protein